AAGVKRDREAGDAVVAVARDADADAEARERLVRATPVEVPAHRDDHLDTAPVEEVVIADHGVVAIAKARRAAAAERERGGRIGPVALGQLIRVVAFDAQPAGRDVPAAGDPEAAADPLIVD